MNVTLRITRNGDAPGTIGWLCAHAHSIKIGTNRNDRQAAWLLDETGKSIGLLCVRGPWGGKQVERTTRNHGDYSDEYPLCLDQTFTDAAWRVFQQAQDIAISQMEAGETQEDAATVTLSITK